MDYVLNVINKLQSSSFNIKIFIIDNYPGGSNGIHRLDQSINYISSNNIGYGGGHNQAIMKVLNQDGFHFVLNADIDFDSQIIDNMITEMIKNPSYGLLGPKLIGKHGEDQCNTKLIPNPLDLITRRLPSLLMNSFLRHKQAIFEMKLFHHDLQLHVPYLSGCFMLFRNSAFRKVGIFDERFFMYPEDIDISRRFFECYDVIFDPKFIVTHFWNAESRRNIKSFYIHAINMIKYFNKWGWIFDKKRKLLNNKALKLNCKNEI